MPEIIRPFCNAVSVVESPVEEEERGGIIVPTNFTGKSDIKRGIIVSVGACSCEAWEELKPNVIVYYRTAIMINDVWIVSHDSIVAYVEEG